MDSSETGPVSTSVSAGCDLEKTYEALFPLQRFYAGRTAGRHWHYRAIDQHSASHTGQGSHAGPADDRQGPNLSNPPTTNDDLAWINSYTFGYFLQFMTNKLTASNWIGNPSAGVAGKPMDYAQQRAFACTSMYDSPDAGALMASVGTTGYQYYSIQSTPTGAGYTETYMGFIYWGRRANVITGMVYDQNGNLVNPTTRFSFPIKQGQRSTSQTLLTCPAYSSNGYTCYWPHSNSSDAFITHAPVSAVGNGFSDASKIMNGICCAYTDGSARWVPRRQLWTVFEGSSPTSPAGGYDWVFFDNSLK